MGNNNYPLAEYSSSAKPNTELECFNHRNDKLITASHLVLLVIVLDTELLRGEEKPYFI